MTRQQKKDWYYALVALFDDVYYDPSLVNEACAKIVNKVEYFEKESYTNGYDSGYEDGYVDGYAGYEDKLDDSSEFQPR